MERLAGKNRTAWIDYLKAFAIILVIMDHSMNEVGKSTLGYFYIIRMAVPIFVLISGYNFSAAIGKMGSICDWYRWKRIKKKLRYYLCPMLCVFIIWMIYNTALGRFTIPGTARAFCLQSFGRGSYYFVIIVQLYFIFPFLYYLIRKWKGRGYCIVFCINILYEIILWLFPIPQSGYRIIGLRYIMLLALGIWVYDKITNSSRTAKTVILLIISFIVGCIYIGFFIANQENAVIFRYTVWPNTNLFSGLYIVPIFFAIVSLIQKRRIKIKWIHNIISLIGQSSYYILCTQMIMFWGIERIWNMLNVPVYISIPCNIIFAAGSGVCVYLVIGKFRNGFLHS